MDGLCFIETSQGSQFTGGRGSAFDFHCFIMHFLGGGNSSLLICSKAECVFNRGLYIENILPSSRNGLEIPTIAQH